MSTLEFKGKQIVYAHHLTIPPRTLEIDAGKPLPLKGERASLGGNLIIHGDDLHALKALMPRYAARANCIYIDPPYNTGSEKWLCNDNVNSPMMQEWLKNNGPVDGEDLEQHNKWLCMMWPRLQLLRELLAEDGVIFISIDDNEQHHLRMMMDEIFGVENFVATLIKKTKIGRGSDSLHFVKEHEYIFAYTKNIELLNPVFVRFSDKYLSRYKETDSHGKLFWDTFARLGLRQPLGYTITAPDGQKITGDWIRSKDRFKADLKNKEIEFRKNKDGSWSIVFKRRLNLRRRKPRTPSSDLGGMIEGKKEIADIFGNYRMFPYPKYSGMVKFLLESISMPDAIVLDSFASSGTTAHAVPTLNKQDGGKRQFILVEYEDYADKITAERVRHVIKGVPKSKDEHLKNGLGSTFTYCTIGKEIGIENMLIGKHLQDYETFARHLIYTTTGQSLDKICKARGKGGVFFETPNCLLEQRPRRAHCQTGKDKKENRASIRHAQIHGTKRIDHDGNRVLRIAVWGCR